MQRQFIAGLTACFGYGDFLAATIPHAIPIFDDLLVVTTETDEETREVCRRYGVRTLLTNEHERYGGFSKGHVLDRGFHHLPADCWRIHFDSDIVFPLNTRRALEAAHLVERKIYGADRVMVKSWSDWQKLKHSGWLAHDYHCRVNPPAGFSIGTRWANEFGYCPIGYLQITHSSAEEWNGARIRPYPSNHNSAARTDAQRAMQFDRRDRELIPELLVVHLESEPAKLGANWNGRTTKRFGPGPQHNHEPKAAS
ncbi:MAG: hypothetical protein JO353_13025 [Phycisphaerae bacterium]|nr:hypothetical protein [Phycisphaerae bacterium]